MNRLPAIHHRFDLKFAGFFEAQAERNFLSRYQRLFQAYQHDMVTVTGCHDDPGRRFHLKLRHLAHAHDIAIHDGVVYLR